jgi:hypothetical protein
MAAHPGLRQRSIICKSAVFAHKSLCQHRRFMRFLLFTPENASDYTKKDVLFYMKSKFISLLLTAFIIAAVCVVPIYAFDTADDGARVVLLCYATNSCKNVILNDLACENVLFDVGNGSYYEAKETLDAVNMGIAQLQAQVRSGAVTDADATALMNAYPRTMFDEGNNTVSVVFKVSPDSEKDENALAYIP